MARTTNPVGFACRPVGFACALVSTVVSLLAVACHGNRSEIPPVHLIQNMDFQSRFDAQEQNDFFRPVDCRQRTDEHGVVELNEHTGEPLYVNPGCRGRANRMPVPGTVAVGHLKDDDEYYRGRGPDGRLFDRLPAGVKLTPQLLARGEERYNIYCQPCHDATGEGKGVATRRGGGFKVAPGNFHDPRLRAMPLAYFVDVINNGKGTMLSYAAQIPIEDRWAIAAWARTLQVARTEEGK
jgi:mono/diheme cytochrome c family protein